MIKPTASLALCLTIGLIGLAAQAPAPVPADEFYVAIRGGDIEKVSTLIQGGADVNIRDRRGRATPLMHAAAYGTLDTMRLLLDKGADVNARNAGNATALMWAVSDLAKVRLLLDRGADVNIVSSSGRTALFLAALSDGSAETVRLLLVNGANARVVDSRQMTTLVAAAYGNDAGTVRQLIEAGVDVNAADAVLGSTPLMNAARNGNLEAVKLLLAKGANVNAVSGAPSEQVKNGVINLGRFTPLTLAATGPVDVVKALIAGGAQVNATEVRGLTPLMAAAATDHADLETVKTLIAHGADLRVKSLDGETALDWAQKSGPTRVVAMLTNANAPSGSTAMTPRNIPSPAPVAHRAAIERSVSLLERAAGTFFVNSTCGACHAQNVTDFATMAARKHGVHISDEAAAQRATGAAAAFAATASRLLERQDTPVVDIPLYTLGGLSAGDYPADRATDALVFNIAAQQMSDGRWHVGGIARPPIEDGDFSRTALGVRALTVYGPAGRGPEMRDRTARAVGWLRTSKPLTTEDRSFRLLGLKWGEADIAIVRQAARQLSATQHADGGWAQRNEMTSDAYATGLALYALMESGSAMPGDAAVQRGTKYLLSTQRADGSWFVRSRSPKFQPYFQGGFPYDHDQWISAMATGWSTAALALGLDEGAAKSAVLSPELPNAHATRARGRLVRR
jgi:ankyrin repeat protein